MKLKIMKLVFATNNKHKLAEIQQVLGDKFEIISLKDLNFSEDIPEPHDSLEDNAREKSSFVYNRFKMNCFADDTGLEIEALNGEPGVYAARYAGENPSYDDNMNKVLENLKGIENRKARFRTVVSLIIDGKEFQFEGIVEGKILKEKHGDAGFGYDPIFMPDGYNQSFAQMSHNIKNKISHRGKAIEKLIAFLRLNYGSK